MGKNFEVTFAIFSVLVFQISVLESYLDIYLRTRLLNMTLKYVKSQRSYGFLITKEVIFSFQILDLKDHFSAFLNSSTLVIAVFFSRRIL